jgi:two-component system phosphate regulon sensor histidine kinase PhoR
MGLSSGVLRTVPLSRLLLSVLLSSGVVLLVLTSLAAGGYVDWLPALSGAAAIVVVQSVLLRAFFGGLREIRHGLAGMRDVDDPVPALRPTSPAARDLWLSITRVLRIQRRRIAQLEAELDSTNQVVAALPDPMLLIDGGREIRQANRAARELFGENIAGRDLSTAIRNPAVLGAADAVLRGGGARLIEFNTTVPVERSFRARIERIESAAGTALVTLTDLTTLKRSEQLRADFVANASHELRTPLSTIIGFIETLEGPAAEDHEARARFLPIMRQQAARMARLVDDLLSLSRIELNEHLPPRGEVELTDLLRGMAQTLDLKAAARHMRIVMAADAPDVTAPGDEEELSQLFQNLIDNALKYGAEESEVALGMAPSRKLKQGVAVSVRDRGDGIAREHIPRLTERFYRVDTARSRAMGGTGLGLAIVKHIVSRHRGILEIDSELGKGSVFTVHLPATAPVAPPVAARAPTELPRVKG